MQKICIPIFYLLFTSIAFSQKKLPNPKIGNNETEINLFWSNDAGPGSYSRTLLGAEAIYRVSWRKFTKIGGGLLLAADQAEYSYRGDAQFYGAAFADITQFIGKRQLCSLSGRVGHGIYKEEVKFSDSTGTKRLAGMYYSISASYRIIVSKKILISVSTFMFFRNFRRTSVGYTPTFEIYKPVEKYSGIGLRFGIVF